MNEHDAPLLVPRRDFLILGSAAAVGAVAANAAPGLTRAPKPVDAAAPLPLGYVDGNVDDLLAAARPRAIANAGRLGAHALGSVARVKIHGIVRAGGARTAALELDAIYRVAGHGEVPYHAWADHDARRGDSSAVGFLVGVGPAAPLTFALTTRRRATWRDALALRLLGTPLPPEAVRASATLPRAGVYFIAVPAAGQPAPNWASIRAVAPAEGKLPRLVQSGILGTNPVPFDYIVVGTEQA